VLYRVVHETGYEYTGDVSVSQHVARLRPRILPRQQVREFACAVEPAPASAPGERTDYYGNIQTFFTVEGAHRRLTVWARSVVAVELAVLPLPEDTPPWETAAAPGVADADASPGVGEFRYDSPLVRRRREFADYARPSFGEGTSLLTAVLDLTRRIHAEFAFDPEATTVATPLEQVLRERRGVCQDFAHLQIACLRSLGLAARYVSGYLETVPPPGRPRLTGADASHAWLAVFCPGQGWIDVDPTNNLLPSDRHITVAWGRDYSDVSPIRGVIVGGGHHQLKVAVDVEPLAEAEAAAG
jgi:transglutaminase-like putative cysteine protease